MGTGVPGAPTGTTTTTAAAAAAGAQVRPDAEDAIQKWLQAVGLPAEPEIEPVGTIIVEHSYEAGAFFAILGFTYMILCFVTRTQIDAYEQEEQKISGSLSDSLDTARSGTSLCIIFSVLLMLTGFGIILYKYKMKNAFIKGRNVYAFDPMGSGGTWLLWLFVALNLSTMITFATTTVAQPWFNELKNSSSYVLMGTSVITTLLTLVYVGYKVTEATSLREKFQFTKALVKKAIEDVSAMTIANQMASNGAYSKAELEKINRTGIQSANDAVRAATGLGAKNVPRASENASAAEQLRVATKQLELTQYAIAQTPSAAVAQKPSTAVAQKPFTAVPTAVAPKPTGPSERSKEAAILKKELERVKREQAEFLSLLEQGETDTAPSAPFESVPEKKKSK